MYYKMELERFVDELIKRQEELRRELENSSEGHLQKGMRHGHPYYYRRIPKGGNRKKEHRYSVTGNDAAIRELLRKNYIKEALPAIANDIRILERTLKSYKAFDPGSMQQRARLRFPELGPEFFDPSTEAHAWAADYEQTNFTHMENMVNVDLKGIVKRSRGELYIGERLAFYNIPHKYEAPLELTVRTGYGFQRMTVHPDYTIMRPRDGKIFYWEHKGNVNDLETIRSHRARVLDYEQNGIVEWDNLILTYDTKEGGINTALIENQIRTWLL